MGTTGRFNVSINKDLEKIAIKIDELQQQYQRYLDNIKDVWTPLGRQAAFLRTVFNGVSLPIKDKKELIKELGGEDRVIIAPSVSGYLTAVTVKDLIKNLNDFLDQGIEYPVVQWESLVHQIIKWEYNAKKSGNKRLLKSIESNHLISLTKDKEKSKMAFPNQRERKHAEKFELQRQKYTPVLRKAEKGKTLNLLSSIFISDRESIIEAILNAIRENKEKQASIVFSKTSSANTHLNNAEQFIVTGTGYLKNVLRSNDLTQAIHYNNLAQGLLDSANQLIAQAIADLAAAEAAAQAIPENKEAQEAVAKTHQKLEDVQNQQIAFISMMSQAEEYKDILSIPEVGITIRCIEEDPCCDDDWNGVNVYVKNLSHTGVPEASGTTSGNGSVTIFGRFGNSSVLVRTTGDGGWNETRTLEVLDHGASYTIKVDLPGNE